MHSGTASSPGAAAAQGQAQGPGGWLAGVQVLEFATVGALPYAGLMLAQMGATVRRVQPPQPRELGVPNAPEADIGLWMRQTTVLDLKQPDGLARALALAAASDVLIEGYRPGVMERLGLGPERLLAEHPGLIYARLTGWGQSGPWAGRAGHDLNYIAMSGALHAIGPAQGPPSPPLNLIADLAAGGGAAVTQILGALHARSRNGRGAVLDIAMVDGSLHLLTAVYARLGVGRWQDRRESNVLDGGVPWYRCYRCADGGWMAVAAIEQRFYDTFVRTLGLDGSRLPAREAPGAWPVLAERFADSFATHPRAHWERCFEAIDACVTPVLGLGEAAHHLLHRQRARFDDARGWPVPRFGVEPGGRST
jgi:alpha-methylacyl-CoA racemase